jgi:hypothetical protein
MSKKEAKKEAKKSFQCPFNHRPGIDRDKFDNCDECTTRQYSQCGRKSNQYKGEV